MHESMLLDPAEESIYRLLIGLAVAPAARLAEVAGVPIEHAGHLLRSLEAKGLVVRHGTIRSSAHNRPTWRSAPLCFGVRSRWRATVGSWQG